MGNLVFQATLGGQVNLVGPNTASTFNINVPTVNGNMVTTGDTGTVTNTMLAGSIANAKLLNSSVTVGSTSIALGATSTTLDGVNIGATTAGTGAFTTLSGSTSVTTPIVKSASSLTLQSNGTTTAVTIDTSQNVGIGTASPSYKLDVQGTTANQRISSTTGTNAAYQIFSNSGQNFYVGLDNSAGNQILSAAYGATFLGTGAYPMVFGTNNAERMRITSAGRLGIGSGSPNCILDITSSDSGNSYQTLNITNTVATSTSKGTNRIVRIASNANGADTSIQFTDNVSNNYFFGGYNGVAYVSSNLNQGVKLSAGATSWASDSDERLKNIKKPITNAVENLSTLRTVYGNYKDDLGDVSRLFLIAQDVQKVYPEVVDVYQDEQQTLGLRYSDLVPVLVAAIQELKAINDTQAETINALTARMVALEAK